MFMNIQQQQVVCNIIRKHKENAYIWHLDFLKMARHQAEKSIVTLVQLSRVLLWTKNCIFAISKVKDTHENTQKYIILFNTSLKI